MVKGQIISGEFSKILVRQKNDANIELGELLVADYGSSKIMMQVYDLLFGSQISQQNLELISGMQLEDGNDAAFFDAELRNYNLALLKNLITFDNSGVRISKSMPKFFSTVRDVCLDDLKFITKPSNPMFVGNLRSGSKVLDVPVFLDGANVLSHHVLVPATTGRGKSLDENEEVLVKTSDDLILIKTIGELVNNSKNFRGSKVLSMNHKNFSIDVKNITKFVKHKAPKFMFNVVTASGREVLVTGDHNLHVMRDGVLRLLKTQEITTEDYLPLPVEIGISGNLSELNLFDLLMNYEEVFVLLNKRLVNKLKPKRECLNILSKYFTRPSQKYREVIINKRMRITLLNQLLAEPLSRSDLNSLSLTDLHGSTKLRALFSLSKEFLELLGLFIAEGYCLNDNSFRISCSEKEVQRIVVKALDKIGLNYFWIKKEGKSVGLGISSSVFTKLLKSLNVGTLSGNKRLPCFFMNLSNEKLGILLRAYFDGDGGVDATRIPTSRKFKISSTTKSKKLASDLCMALYRFGILARCKSRFLRATNTNHKGNTYYRISISGRQDLNSFLVKIGFNLKRKDSFLRNKLEYRRNTNIDVVPVRVEDFKKRREQTALNQKQFASKVGCSQQLLSLIESGKRRPSRSLFIRIMSVFENFRDLKYLMNFRWDEIKKVEKIKYNKRYVYDITVKDNKTFLAGHGGVFVHNSNLTSCVLWDNVGKGYAGVLVLDPHDEYYGRDSIGLKDHPQSGSVVYYTPKNPPVGCKTLRINLLCLKPNHFDGAVDWSLPQKDALVAYYKEYGNKWIEAIVLEKPLNLSFNEATLAVVRRKVMGLLDLSFSQSQLRCNGVFDLNSGESTVKDIVAELENGKIVIVDTSGFSGSVEILIGSLISAEILYRYKSYKFRGELDSKPVVSIVLEEAPRVLGKDALERGPNIFSTIAREGRKFKVGLFAITQLPSLIPRQILANINTKIILGIEMAPERQAIIESSAQDLSNDNRTIASLDKGEAIITSNFAKFAMPVKIPLFSDMVKSVSDSSVKKDFSGVGL